MSDMDGKEPVPYLLAKRMGDFNYPKCFLDPEALFDRVLIAKMPPHNMEVKLNGAGAEEFFYTGTNFKVPPDVVARHARILPRGIIVAAGLLGLEQMRTNGVDVGHIVSVLRMTPYDVSVGLRDMHLVQLTAIRASDLIYSEDTRRLLREGKIRRVYKATPEWSGYLYETCEGYENDPEANFIPKGILPVKIETVEG